MHHARTCSTASFRGTTSAIDWYSWMGPCNTWQRQPPFQRDKRINHPPPPAKVISRTKHWRWRARMRARSAPSTNSSEHHATRSWCKPSTPRELVPRPRRSSWKHLNTVGSLDDADVICHSILLALTDPPSAPLAQVSMVTYNSVHLVWESSRDQIITGYIVHYKRQESSEWKEIRLTDVTSYVHKNLQCGTRYLYYLVGFNAAGKGDPSQVLSARTNGTGM